jgi:hypothetical protein
MVACLLVGSACGGISTQRLWSHQSGHPGKEMMGAERATDHRSLRNARRAIPGNRGGIWTGSRDLPRWSALLLFTFLVPATFVSHSFWLAAGTPQFQGKLINFCKNTAIWGRLVFVAGTKIQPSFLPRHTTGASGVHAKSNAQMGTIHVEAD